MTEGLVVKDLRIHFDVEAGEIFEREEAEILPGYDMQWPNLCVCWIKEDGTESVMLFPCADITGISYTLKSN